MQETLNPTLSNFLILTFAVIDFGKTALAGCPEAVAEINACFVHCPAHHIVADIPGAGEEMT